MGSRVIDEVEDFWGEGGLGDLGRVGLEKREGFGSLDQFQ